MGGGGGGGKTTSVQDVPPEFKPAYYRLFNSGFGAAQQGAQNPFAGPTGFQGYPNPWANYPGMGGMQQPMPQQQGMQQGAAQMQQPQMQQPQQQQGLYPGQGYYPGQVQTPPTGNMTPGQQYNEQRYNPNAGFDRNLPAGYNAGTSNIPLSGGPPIIGSPFPGPFTAPSTPIEMESLMQREQVGRQLGGLGTPSLNLGQAQASGAFLNPYTNPAFQGNLQASLQPAFDYFTRAVAPQFGSQALQSGAYKGSSARDMAFGNLANDFGRNLAQTAAQAGMQNYMQERQIQQNAPQFLQQAAGIQQLSPEILAQVGAGQRELMQRPLDELLLQFQEAQQAPFRPLGPLASLIQGTNIGTTQTLQAPRPSPLASGIAGGLGGAALGTGLANAAGLGGSLGGYGGAAAGGLGALLGGLAGGFG